MLHVERERIMQPAYLPCRCLCLGFLELKVKTKVISTLNSVDSALNYSHLEGMAIYDIPNNVNTVLATDRLGSYVSILNLVCPIYSNALPEKITSSPLLSVTYLATITESLH